jgi:hypothetical protein
MNLIERLKAKSVTHLVRVACVLALVGLAVMVLSVVYPIPLLVIVAMSVGHAIGMAAFGCYLLAVLLDLTQNLRQRNSRVSVSPASSPKQR